MTTIFKARHSIFYSLLFVSIGCQSFAAFAINLKKTEPCNLQIAESDNPREAFKKALSASQGVKSYRLRIEIPSASKVATLIEYALPDRVRISEKDKVALWIGKNRYNKDYRYWSMSPGAITDESLWTKQLDEGNPISAAAIPVTTLEKLIKILAKTEGIKFIGQESVEGIPTLVYQHTRRWGNELITMKTWIGLADGLLRKWEFECDLALSAPSPVIYTFYDYNADIKIEPPTEDELELRGVPGPPSPYPGSGGGIGSGGGKGPGRGSVGGPPDGSAKAVDTRPILLNRPQPIYTEEASKNKIQGTVLVRVLVGADGSVKRVTLIRGLPYGLTEEAILAAYQLRFKPAMKDGQPVAFWQTVAIEVRP